MKLSEIIKKTIDSMCGVEVDVNYRHGYIKKIVESMSGVIIDVNYRHGYITISENCNEIFLQGDDFNFFMQMVETIGDVDGITYEERLLFVAEFYTSVIWSN